MPDKLYKYPRTPHFPFSPGATNDDKILTNTDHFKGKWVVVTEKMDGENTTIYKDFYHARSLDSAHRDYHSWLLGYIASIKHSIYPGTRICGEYLYAKHSIGYDDLPSYFLGFSLWHDNICEDWLSTKEEFQRVGIISVPELYYGEYDEDFIKGLAESVVRRGGEGIVVRLADEFKYEDFEKSVAKYVRPNHVQTDTHWSNQKIEKNHLKGDKY